MKAGVRRRSFFLFKKESTAMRTNNDLLDAVSIVSFLVGLANYNENLTQSNKDDIMRRLDQQTNSILTRVQRSLDEQNSMLREILRRLEK